MTKAQALEFFGGPVKLASLLGLKSRQAIYAWPEEVPDLYQYKLHHLSEGRLAITVESPLPVSQQSQAPQQ